MSHTRIKLPGKTSDVPEPNDHQRRHPVKRSRHTIDSEDEDEEESSINRRRNSLPSSLDSLTDEEQPESSTSKPAVPVPPNDALKRGSQTKTKANGPPRKKPRKLVVTDPESEDYEDSVQQVSEDDEPESFLSDDRRPRTSKGNAISGKEAGARKGVKRKHITEPLNIAEAQLPLTKGGAKSRPASKLHEPLIDVVGGDADDSQAVDSPLAVVDDSSAPAKKRARLPTIKKNKIPASAGPSTPSTPAVASKLDPTIVGLKVAEPKQGAARAAAIAATDLDLGNKSVYNELFRGGNTPGGGGSNRRTKEEERRKELNKMREDARIKRALEATVAFDLQAQHDKISRFEDKLKAEHSSALYPNFLAAKWREQYERERRRKERARDEGRKNEVVS